MAPKVVVQEVVTRAGFVTSMSHAYDIIIYPPGTTRAELKSGKRPLVNLTYDHVAAIQDECSTDEEVLFAISHVAEHGTIPNKMQSRIEQVIGEKSSEYELKIKALENKVAMLVEQAKQARAETPKKGKQAEVVADPQ